MIYVHKQSLTVYTEQTCRNKVFEDFTTILPARLSTEVLEPYGFVAITDPIKPLTQPYEYLELSEPYIENSQYKIRWNVKTKENLDQIKKEYIEKLRIQIEPYLQKMKETYPDSEVDGWDLQEKEARGFIANSNYPTPCLNALSSSRNIDKTVLANRIIQKANIYAHIYGTIIGTRQYYEDLIVAATSISELPTIPGKFNFYD